MKIVDKLKNHYLAKCAYIKYVKKLSLEDHVILLESQQSKEYGGNMYYIAKELNDNSEYADFKIFLSVTKGKVEKARAFYALKGLSRIQIIESNTKRYYRLMASAKFLMSDNTFLPFFIKKEGQIYFNTWHGTPLKTLGKKIHNDMHDIGNTQKNFVAADYLLYPNEYTKDHMLEDYMLKNLCHNRFLIDGYPRNTAFFNDKLKESIRKKYQLENKQVIAYMPTWRGTLTKKNNAIMEANIQYILEEFEDNLRDNQVVYVNLHPIESASVDFSSYQKVKPFPDDYETYEFLNIADVLVTDYSSVFFDFLNTGKKIILYTYDKLDYLSSRGVYRKLESFPFPIVESMSGVISEINTPKSYDDQELRLEFCKYDDMNATARLCQRVILDRNMGIQEGLIEDNQKENVFIFAGRLANNGITSSLKNLVNHIDKTKRNYYLLVSTRDVKKNLDILEEFSQQINYYAFKGMMNLTITQKIKLILYKLNIIKTDRHIKHMKEAYRYELKRMFAGARVDTLIQFSGYGNQRINLFSCFDGNKIIYVHANMLEEINLRKNQRRDVLHYAYNAYDKVAVVTEDIIDSTYQISKRKDNIFVCHNVIDYETIQKKSNEKLEISEVTAVYPKQSDLYQKLSEEKTTKIVNVGRFSPEKGQMRLLDAFAKIHQTDPDTVLIIIGGSSYGNYYSQIIKHIEQLQLTDSVVLVKNLPNPFPLIKCCDFFILSSFAEGFGLVVAEADVLGLPVVSVDISGPRNFMKKYKGYLVEDSTDGIVQGMMRGLHHQIQPMNIDFRQYNQEAVQEFDRLFMISEE